MKDLGFRRTTSDTLCVPDLEHSRLVNRKEDEIRWHFAKYLVD